MVSRLSRIGLCLAILLTCFGCGEEEVGPLSLSTGRVYLFVGTSFQLTATKSSEWLSSDPTVATVDAEGTVQAIGTGTATVTATSDGESASAEIKVNPTVAANTRLTEENSHQEFPCIVVDENGRLVVGWIEEYRIGYPMRVAFARSLDGGDTWSTTTLMDPDSSGYKQTDPWLAIDELGRVYYARLEWPPSSWWTQFRIIVSRSDDVGATWGPTINVGNIGVDKPVIESDGNGTLYVACHRPDFGNILVTHSLDGGTTWAPMTQVRSTNDFDAFAFLAPQPGGTVYVAWWVHTGEVVAPGDIFVAVSEDRGLTWGDAVRVNPTLGSVPLIYEQEVTRTAFPSIVTSTDGTVFVAWPDYDGSSWDVVISRSDDLGTTWSAPVRINDVTNGDQWMVMLAIGSDGTLHAIWYDRRTGEINAVYAQSTDNGQTWSTNVRLSTEQTYGETPWLGAYIGLAVGSDGTAYAVWTDKRAGETDIYFASITGF